MTATCVGHCGHQRCIIDFCKVCMACSMGLQFMLCGAQHDERWLPQGHAVISKRLWVVRADFMSRCLVWRIITISTDTGVLEGLHKTFGAHRSRLDYS